LISTENISLFLGQEKPKLKVHNFEMKKGLWALVGRNGAGKTTFLRTVSGANSNFSGKINLDNENLSNYSGIELAKKIAVVFSKVDLFGEHTALDILFLGRIPYQGLFSKTTARDKMVIDKVVELLNIQALLHKTFSVLSDGEKQLVMIGRALVQDTNVIILDEPTAFLDVVNRKTIVEILAKIATDKLIIFSTHNIDLIDQFCDGMLLIQNNELEIVKTKNEFKDKLNKLFENEI